MKVVHTISDLKAELKAQRLANKSVGLVPTMGALHAGHASLVSRSLAENDVTVVSIFVNPTQFNDKNDLAKYPRTLENDCLLLENVLDIFIDKELIAFAPSVEEVYPEPDTRQFSYPPTDEVMEGGFRPGHFNGVNPIVPTLAKRTSSRLLLSVVWWKIRNSRWKSVLVPSYARRTDWPFQAVTPCSLLLSAKLQSASHRHSLQVSTMPRVTH